MLQDAEAWTAIQSYWAAPQAQSQAGCGKSIKGILIGF